MGVTQPVLVFFEACVLGFCLGALYDVFRILRLSFPHNKILVFLEDVLYFFLITVISFSFILLQNNGTLRAFLLLGELMGAILYFFTLSILIMKAANAIIKAVYTIMRFFYRITVKPFIRFFKFLFCLFRRIGRIFVRKLKIILRNSKKHLKERKALVYNKTKHSDETSYFTP